MPSLTKPICIIGMHRSGTSMTANLLAKCGVSFGLPEELLSANASNSLGYFEHERITYEVNDALLAHFGGSWEKPPKLPHRWEHEPKINSIRKRALSIISDFEHQPHWGWKDPRTSLLLPFWQTVVPEMSYIICLRSPIDVAKSLDQREGLSFSDSSKLWYRYISDAMNNTNGRSRLIVFYEDFFKNTQYQIQRLIEFTRTEQVTNPNLDRLSKTVFTKLRHQQSTARELENISSIDSESKLLFQQLYRKYAVKGNNADRKKPAVKKALVEAPNNYSFIPEYPLEFPKYENPTVSIVIPTHNRVELLSACLRSVLQFTELPYQLIIVDDHSTDQTDKLLEKLINVDVIKNKENLDFLKSVNLGADKAKGKYLVFLNNDVTVRSGWLNILVNTIESKPNCGAVGAKLVSMNGKLQEAGCTVWPDGTVTLVGNNDNPFKPEYSYLREVDYCSGACLLVNRNLFFKLGKLDPRFAPAYYEDVDLCMSIWESGNTVIYQPEVTVFHHHMGSRPLSRVRYLLDKNCSVFRRKWQHRLALRSNIKNTFFVRNRHVGKRILIVGSSMVGRGVGINSNGTLRISTGLAELNYGVSLLAPKVNTLSKVDLMGLQQSGVEVFHGNNIDLEKILLDRANQYDFVVFDEEREHPHFTHLIKSGYPHASLGNEALLKELIDNSDKNE